MIDFTQILQEARESGKVPFSFTIGERPAEFVFRRERPDPRAEKDRPGGTLVFEEKQAPLTVILEWREARGSAMLTMEWRILARGSVAEPIRQVHVLDLHIAHSAETRLHGWNGGYVYRNGKNEAFGVYPPREFREWERDLTREPVELEDRDGRASTKFLPLWLIADGRRGFWFGPEWSGSWNFAAAQTGDGDTARVQVGLPCLDFRVLQGEEIAMPAVILGTFEGAWRDGCVAMRRAIREDIMPPVNGAPPVPRTEANFIGGSRPELDEAGLNREVRLAAALGLEHMVWAAAWYRPPTGFRSFLTDDEIAQLFPHFEDRAAYQRMSFWESCGPFIAHEERFGGDIRAFSERLARLGIVHGLWYDPRFGYTLPEYQQNLDALIPPAFRKPQDKGYAEGHIDMSTRAGVELMESILERMVSDYGARYLWHDLNTAPRPNYWEHYEEPERRGLTELRHYKASDALYDRFLERHPDVWIMWCGGGGSMINLSVLRRCHSLWIADNNDYSTKEEQDTNTDIGRAYRTALNWILPSSYITNFLSAAGTYQWRERVGMRDWLAQMGGTFTISAPLANLAAEDHADLARALGLFRAVRHFLTKDFWSLFPPAEDREGWDGWQFHDPETGSGILVLFKRRDSRVTEQTVSLKWVEAPGDLTIGCMEGDATVAVQGADLRVTLRTDAALLRYDSESRTTRTGRGSEMMTQ